MPNFMRITPVLRPISCGRGRTAELGMVERHDLSGGQPQGMPGLCGPWLPVPFQGNRHPCCSTRRQPQTHLACLASGSGSGRLAPAAIDYILARDVAKASICTTQAPHPADRAVLVKIDARRQLGILPPDAAERRRSAALAGRSPPYAVLIQTALTLRYSSICWMPDSRP